MVVDTSEMVAGIFIIAEIIKGWTTRFVKGSIISVASSVVAVRLVGPRECRQTFEYEEDTTITHEHQDLMFVKTISHLECKSYKFQECRKAYEELFAALLYAQVITCE